MNYPVKVLAILYFWFVWIKYNYIKYILDLDLNKTVFRKRHIKKA